MKFRIKNKGFTLIETLVAAAVLSVAVAGPLTIAHKSLNTATGARDQVTASYLGQEAIEYIRNVRDQNRLQPGEWLRGLNACMSGGTCGVDAVRGSIIACETSNDNCRVKYDESRGVYGHPSSGSGWQDTRFRRTVQMVNTADREVRVTVSVTWATGPFGSRTISISSTLYALK